MSKFSIEKVRTIPRPSTNQLALIINGSPTGYCSVHKEDGWLPYKSIGSTFSDRVDKHSLMKERDPHGTVS